MRSYTINADVMFRDDVPIARVVKDDLEFLPGMLRYAGPAKKFFRDFQALGAGCMDESAPDMRVSDKIHFGTEPVEALRRRYPDYRGTINPGEGDMTVEFVWWLHIHYPFEAEVRYKGRTIRWK